jgi:hypothetical protein
METTGTTLARTPRMRERTVSPVPSILVQPTAPEAGAPIEEETEHAAAEETRDKYDLADIACTD